MKGGIRVLLCLMALGLAACGGGKQQYAVSSGSGTTGTYKVGNPYKINGVWYTPAENPNYDKKGVASWYGPKFHGRQTANGEIYNMNDMTAAHPTLPMPSYVLVTNLENGRQAVLRVNDRGPFAKNRIIDVSRRAAQVLGFEQNGLARVRVQAYPLKTTQPPPPIMVQEDTETKWGEPVFYADAADGVSVFVQAGAFADRNGAERVKNELSPVGTATVSSVLVDGRSLYRVRIGPMASVNQADGILTRIREMGHDTARVVFECNSNC